MQIPRALISLAHPVQTILVRKIGASYLRVLFYYLDHFKLPEKAMNLENEGVLYYEEPLPRVTSFGDIRFVFYRHPLDRLIAFYYDEIFLDGPLLWQDWRKKLIKRGYKQCEVDNIRQHQKNLAVLICYIEERVKSDGLLNLPEQLAPQYMRLLPAIDNGFDTIDLIRANFELESLLEREVPGIDKIIKRVARRIKPFQIYNTAQIVTPSVAKRHYELYQADFEYYWAQHNGET